MLVKQKIWPRRVDVSGGIYANGILYVLTRMPVLAAQFLMNRHAPRDDCELITHLARVLTIQLAPFDGLKLAVLAGAKERRISHLVGSRVRLRGAFAALIGTILC